MNPNTNPTTPNTASQNTVPAGVKSSVAAGLLGIFLGGFGAHNWYLGDKKRGIIHLALTCGGFILTFLAAVMTALTAKVPFLAFFFGFVMFLSYIAIVGSSIWGFVEGIILLVQGDAALAAKGYTVAAPITYAQPVQPAAPAATEEVKETAEEVKETPETTKSEAKTETKEEKKDDK